MGEENGFPPAAGLLWEGLIKGKAAAPAFWSVMVSNFDYETNGFFSFTGTCGGTLLMTRRVSFAALLFSSAPIS